MEEANLMDPKKEVVTTDVLLGHIVQLLADNAKLMDRLAGTSTKIGDEDYEAQHRAIQAKMHPAGPEQVIHRNITANSGAVWDFVISPQSGNVFDLVFVRLPAGSDRHQSAGGIVPDGLPIFNVPQEHRPQIDKDGNDQSVVNADTSQLTMQYRQYIRESYTLPDRRQYVGKPMPEHLKPRRADKAAE